MLVKIANDTEVLLENIVCVVSIEDIKKFLATTKFDELITLEGKSKSAVFVAENNINKVYLSPYSCKMINKRKIAFNAM